MHKGLRAVLIVTVLALGILAAMQLHTLYERNVRLIKVGNHRIDPLAPVDGEKRYGIVLWEQPLPWHGGLSPDRRRALETAAAEFMAQHPNVHIEIAFHDGDDFVTTVQQATLAGVGPDIIGLSAPGILIDDQFQVPVSPYMQPAVANDVIPAVRRAMVYDGMLWAWPRWALPLAWLAWDDVLPDSPNSLPSPIISASDLLRNTSRLRQFTGDEPPVVYSAFDPGLFVSVAVASSGVSLLSDDGAIQWSEAMLTDLGAAWHDMVQHGTLHPGPRQVATSRLSRFDARQAAIVAAPAWPTVQLLLARYGDFRHDGTAWALNSSPALRFTSAPYTGDRVQGTSGRVAGYAVLLQNPTAGDDHVVVAMRVAEYFSHRVGAWEAATHLALPAYTSALAQWEIDSGLAPAHARAWYDLSQHLISPPAPYAWASLETALYEHVVVPAFVALLDGDVSPEQFGRQLARDIPAYVAAHGPKNNLSLQIP